MDILYFPINKESPKNKPEFFVHTCMIIEIVISCPREDRLCCPRPRPHRHFYHPVLVLVLILMDLKVLVLVLEDHGPVLVPSLLIDTGT